MQESSSSERTVIVLFRSLFALSMLSVLATLFELASLRHWEGTQFIPWLLAGAVLVGLGLTAAGTARTLVRAICAVSVVGSLFGVWEHVQSNFESGPLDRRLGPTWDSMSTIEKGWKAFTQTVGPSPALAPMALALSGVLLALASWCRPDVVNLFSRRAAAGGR
jgi:hypothetical protein